MPTAGRAALRQYSTPKAGRHCGRMPQMQTPERRKAARRLPFLPYPVLASKPRGKGHQIMVRTERLELSHLAAPEPKSGVSTNFTTSAFDAGNKNARHLAWRLRRIWGGRWESNPRHQEPQSCALPTELRPPYFTLLVPRLPNGTPGRTRTCDHPLRRRMLYPAELRALDHLPEQTLRSFRLQQKP